MPQPHSTPETPNPLAANRTAPAAPHGDAIASALGRIPSGLFIVSWKDAGQDRGMLASWVMQAGFAPPTITIAVAPGRDLLTAISRGDQFAVNVLADGQRSLLARFGRPTPDGENPFTGLEIDRTPHGNAVIRDASSWLECRPLGRIERDGTDHVVVLAEVVDGDSGMGESPLVHLRKNGLRY